MPYLDKLDVIEELCRLANVVGIHYFKNIYAHDCFCGSNPFVPIGDGFKFEPEILRFISDAIEEKMLREKVGKENA